MFFVGRERNCVVQKAKFSWDERTHPLHLFVHDLSPSCAVSFKSLICACLVPDPNGTSARIRGVNVETHNGDVVEGLDPEVVPPGARVGSKCSLEGPEAVHGTVV